MSSKLLSLNSPVSLDSLFWHSQSGKLGLTRFSVFSLSASPGPGFKSAANWQQSSCGKSEEPFFVCVWGGGDKQGGRTSPCGAEGIKSAILTFKGYALTL